MKANNRDGNASNVDHEENLLLGNHYRDEEFVPLDEATLEKSYQEVGKGIDLLVINDDFEAQANDEKTKANEDKTKIDIDVHNNDAKYQAIDAESKANEDRTDKDIELSNTEELSYTTDLNSGTGMVKVGKMKIGKTSQFTNGEEQLTASQLAQKDDIYDMVFNSKADNSDWTDFKSKMFTDAPLNGSYRLNEKVEGENVTKVSNLYH